MATDKDFKVKNGLQVDTDTLVVDATNDRVGINNSSPSYPLDVNGITATDVLNAQGGNYTASIDSTTIAGVVLKQGNKLFSESTSGQYLRNIFQHETSNGHFIFGQTGTSLIGDMKFYAGSSGNFFFATGGSDTTGLQVGTSTTISYQPIRINSGGLQIGTTEVINSSRNLINITGITSTGAFKSSGGDSGTSGQLINAGGSAVNQTNSGTLRLTETTYDVSPYFQGAYVTYDGSANRLRIGTHATSNQTLSDDVSAIEIGRGSTTVDFQGAINVNGNATISSTFPTITFTDTDNNPDYQIRSANGYFQIYDSTNSAPRFNIQNGGDVSFYNDTGTTQGLFWDASTSNLAIGTTSAGARLQVNGSTSDTTANALIVRNSSGNSLFSVRNDGRVDMPQGAVNITNDLTVSGNLTVNGTTTTIDTTNTNVKDNNITLNYSTGDSSATANNAGITIQDAVDASTDATILWDATLNRFNFSHEIKLPDNEKLLLGGGSDLQIYHNATDSVIDNLTGDLYITNKADDKDIVFQSDDGSGGVSTYFLLDGSQAQSRFLRNVKWDDGIQALFGTSDDLRITHDGTNSTIDNFTGALSIRQQVDDGDILFQADDGSGGVTEYFRLDGSEVQNRFSKHVKISDNQFLRIGTDNDLTLVHDTTNSTIKNNTGDLYIENTADDKDIIFRSDDGLGGLAEYIRIDGSITETTFSKTTKVIDNFYLGAGTSTDLYMMHDGTNSHIINNTGDLTIRNNSDDKNIYLRTDDGLGGTVNYVQVDGNAVLTKFLKNTKHLDNVKATFGDSADLEIYHNGTDSFITNDTGIMYIRQNLDDGDILLQSDNGSGGVTTYIQLDGSAQLTNFAQNTKHNDSVKATFGASQDLQIYHDGTNSFINQVGTGSLIIRNSTDDYGINFQSDDGSGGVTDYFYLNGALTKTIFPKDTRHSDSVKANFGNSDDLQIYHDGSNSYIDDAGTGHLFIRANNLRLQKYTGETYLNANADGATGIYYDGAERIVTTLTGVDVTGNIEASGVLYLSNQTATDLSVDNGYFEVTTATGYMRIGSGNASTAHFYTDRTGYFFNTSLTVDSGLVQSYDEDLVLRRTNTSATQLTIGSTQSTFTKPVQAQGFKNSYINYASTPANTAGWFKIGRVDRGTGRIILSFTGGNYSPTTYEILYFKNWSTVADLQLNQHGTATHITSARIRQDSSDSIYYVEIYCASDTNGKSFQVFHNQLDGYFDTDNTAYTGSLTAGSASGTTWREADFVPRGRYMSLLEADDINLVGDSSSITIPSHSGIEIDITAGSGSAGNIRSAQDLFLLTQSGKLHFGTANGNSKVVIDTSGNLGVGTSSPSNLLHLQGSSPIIRFTDTTTSAFSFISADNGEGSVVISADNGNTVANTIIGFKIDNATKATLNTGGSLDTLAGYSVGTTQVIDSSRNLVNVGTISSGSHTSTGDVGFAVNSGGNAYMVIDRSASDRRGALVFSTGATDVPASPPATATIDWAIGVSDSDEVAGDKFYIRQGTTDASGSALLIDSSNNATFANGVTIEGTTTFNDDVSFTGDIISSMNLANNTLSAGDITSSGDVVSSSTNYIYHQVDQTDSGSITMGVSSTTAEGFLIASNTGTNHVATAPALKFMLNTDGGSLVEEVRIDAGGLDIKNGGLDINGTEVITSARNLTNIGLISSTRLNSNNGGYTISYSEGTGQYPNIRLQDTSGTNQYGEVMHINGDTKIRSYNGFFTNGSITFAGNSTYGSFNTSGDFTVNSGSIFLNDTGKGIHMLSPNGTEYQLTVDNSGNLVITEI